MSNSPKPGTTTLQVRLPVELREKATARAKETGTTCSDVMRRALEAFVLDPDPSEPAHVPPTPTILDLFGRSGACSGCGDKVLIGLGDSFRRAEAWDHLATCAPLAALAKGAGVI